MSKLMNSLSKQQCLLIENLVGNKQYGIAHCSKGEIRALRKLGVIEARPQGFALTAEANDLLIGKTEPKYWPRYRGDE